MQKRIIKKQKLPFILFQPNIKKKKKNYVRTDKKKY